MIGQAPLSSRTGVPGWLTDSEELLLLKYAKTTPPEGVIVEIGSEFGRSASLLLSVSHPTIHVYCVDLFPIDLEESHRSNIAEAGLRPAYYLKGHSHRIGEGWTSKRGGNIDLLFVDGDHSFEGVQGDVEQWSRHIKRNGVMIFHDVANTENRCPHVSHFEVARAVQSWYETPSNYSRWQVIDAADSMLAFRRIKR